MAEIAVKNMLTLNPSILSLKMRGADLGVCVKKIETTRNTLEDWYSRATDEGQVP